MSLHRFFVWPCGSLGGESSISSAVLLENVGRSDVRNLGLRATTEKQLLPSHETGLIIHFGEPYFIFMYQ